MSNNFKTPVLFIIFNNPDTTFQVFNEIKKIKPRYFYVASDGPKKNAKALVKSAPKNEHWLPDLGSSMELL